MFNMEKLLGKIVKEAIEGRTGSSSIINNLASNGGLMTAIGLGVGAFEILRDKQTQISNPPPTPPLQNTSHSAPPPLPGRNHTAPPPPIPPVSSASPKENELAVKMIQVIIAAANADGTLDNEEKKAILKRFIDAELSEEETGFLLKEMSNPKSIAELTGNIQSPDISKAMYSLAVQCVPIDTEAERKWFDQLAHALALNNQITKDIEAQAGNID